MKLIVGLGNPGRKYEETRHNVGFIVAAKVAVLTSAGSSKVKFEGELAEGNLDGNKISILCPHTYMNASGQSVRKAFDFYKLELSDLLVVCDDLNLTSARLRIRPSGSAGGQKGIQDIIRHLGSESFPRLRVGIGRPPDGWTVTDYVLGKFSEAEKETFEKASTDAAHAVLCWATEGIGPAMNRFNVKSNTTPERTAPKQTRKGRRENDQPSTQSQETRSGSTDSSGKADPERQKQ